jgi:hypothetical protein
LFPFYELLGPQILAVDLPRGATGALIAPALPADASMSLQFSRTMLRQHAPRFSQLIVVCRRDHREHVTT